MITSITTPRLTLELDLAALKAIAVQEDTPELAQDYQDIMDRAQQAMDVGKDFTANVTAAGDVTKLSDAGKFAEGLFFVLSLGGRLYGQSHNQRLKNGATLLSAYIEQFVGAINGSGLPNIGLGAPICRAFYENGVLRLTATMETHVSVDTDTMSEAEFEATFKNAAAI